MSPFYTILLSVFLLAIGISLSANNRLNSYILGYLFYNDKLSKNIPRILGVLVLGSILLILMNMLFYATLLNIFVALVFTFFTIQGRSKRRSIAISRKLEQERLHREELERRKIELAKTRQRKIKELEHSRNKPKSVKERKDKLWNDGSMTNSEIIKNLNE